MDSKDKAENNACSANDSYFLVRCLICLKIIKYSHKDASALFEHIRTEHPDIIICDSSSGNDAGDEKCQETNKFQMTEETQKVNIPRNSEPEYKSPLSAHEVTIQNDENAKVLYTRRYKVRTPLQAQSPRKRRLYRTSIEKWRPANGSIYCPKCGSNKRPIIRSRSEKFSYNSCGAAFILSCWPFCFLPCVFPFPPKEYLHCADCKNFLGLYDRKAEVIRPNREFVEREACATEAGVMEDCSSEKETKKS